VKINNIGGNDYSGGAEDIRVSRRCYTLDINNASSEWIKVSSLPIPRYRMVSIVY
jgi:hypothetical protein